MAAVWEATKCGPGSSLLVFNQSGILESLQEDPGIWRTAVRLALTHMKGEPLALVLAKDAALPDGMDQLQDVLKELGCSMQLVESLEGAPAASILLLMPGVAKETFALLRERPLREGSIVVLLGLPPEGVLNVHNEEPTTLVFGLGQENGRETLSVQRWEELRGKTGEGPSLRGLGIGQTAGCCCYFDGRMEALVGPAIRLCPDGAKVKWELFEPDENVEKLPKGLAPYASPMQTAADFISAGRALAFTGAGISKESGVPTYRDGDGLWKRYDAMEVSSLAGLVGEPAKGLGL